MAAAEAAAFRDVDEVGWYRAPPNSALRAAAVFDNCGCGIGPPTGTDADMCSDVRRTDGTATGDDWYAKATPSKHAAEAAGNRVVLMANFGRCIGGGMMTRQTGRQQSLMRCGRPRRDELLPQTRSPKNEVATHALST